MENKKRLIDADERLKWLEDNTTEEEWMVNQYNADWIYSMLDSAPTVDAVEVVRCRDCKHCDPENKHCDHPMGTTIPVQRKPDDFCSYGERKAYES